MLSRVAERVYWMARYVERAENTARMVTAFHLLALDMPKSVQLSWKGLVEVTGNDELFDNHYQREDERNCVKFLLADADNPSSVLNSLRAARENVRTTRDLVPSEAWEVMNELYLFARDEIDQGIGKRGRFEFLSSIIQRCQTLTGLLAGTMSHDAAYDFIRLGRNLERADMGTRQVDVGALKLLKKNNDDPEPYEGLLWTSILRSESGFQMYRQHVKRRINGVDVVRFLLQDKAFPRSVTHALTQVQDALESLPNNEVPLRLVIQARRHAMNASVDELLAEDGLHDFVDRLQQDIADIHGANAETWFLAAPAQAA
ncbi:MULTISPECIES: alpha-E domain-containing protein [unclassified Thioalkalivibrio]|uniref:alpha-E domain-containing protein n=1 Tax=unclassified Thioalkalivibrio TaxID=2621013 RepID=UPI00036D8733|nr:MULTISPECIES: alpha-E domain-containing protein [unclassified Thioalkalivibrio]